MGGILNTIASLQDFFAQDWFQFLLVALLGFLTGLELREYFVGRDKHFIIGTSRTYTFIAILGYILVGLDPGYSLYLTGVLVLALLFGLFYYFKLRAGQHGVLQLLIALIVYTYGAVAQHFPPWFLLLLFVAVVFVLNARPLANRIAEGIDRNELQTLAKFVLLSGVILPLLPDVPLSEHIPASPFRMWLGVVVISGISYAGYILKRYLFKRQGYFATGLVGGLYSSTATTVVLARKSKQAVGVQGQLVAAMMAASGMMYLRLLLLVAVLKPMLLPSAAAPLLLIGLVVIGVSVSMAKRGQGAVSDVVEHGGANPLELGVALLFAVLFVAMITITQAVIQYFGEHGLAYLSVIVGFTDIDPFVLSLLNGHYANVGAHQLTGAILIAAGANNVLKGIYALLFGERRTGIRVLLALAGVGVVTAGCGFAISHDMALVP